MSWLGGRAGEEVVSTDREFLGAVVSLAGLAVGLASILALGASYPDGVPWAWWMVVPASAAVMAAGFILRMERRRWLPTMSSVFTGCLVALSSVAFVLEIEPLRGGGETRMTDRLTVEVGSWDGELHVPSSQDRLVAGLVAPAPSAPFGFVVPANATLLNVVLEWDPSGSAPDRLGFILDAEFPDGTRRSYAGRERSPGDAWSERVDVAGARVTLRLQDARGTRYEGTSVAAGVEAFAEMERTCVWPRSEHPATHAGRCTVEGQA